MALKKLKISGKLLLTEYSIRQREAIRNIRANRNRVMLTQDRVADFLDKRMMRLYDRVKINGALTQNEVSDYLVMFASSAVPILGRKSIPQQKKTIRTFESNTQKIVEKIADENTLDQKDIDQCKNNISIKSQKLYDKPINVRFKIVEDIGMDLTLTHEKAQDNNELRERVDAFNEKIIPMGLMDGSSKISPLEFLKLPIGTTDRKKEHWFVQHMKYLEILAQRSQFPIVKLKKLNSLLPYAPKIKYKKYIDVFPRDKFEEAKFMAVVSLWQNNALVRLRGEG